MFFILLPIVAWLCSWRDYENQESVVMAGRCGGSTGMPV